MKLRSLCLAVLLALGVSVVPGCAAPAEGPAGSSVDEIVDVPQTDVERQSIGNCWLYAHASWVESMHKAATGESFDTSQSYWTYWHWFDQIAGGFATKISTGGNWTTANNIVKKYGIAPEAAFVDADTLTEMSSRQSAALAAIDESLKNGVLRDSAARRDKKIVRQELDLAWGLTPAVIAMLDGVFGENVSRTFSSTTSPASAADSPLRRAVDFEVSYPSAPGQAAQPKKLAQAMTDWRQVYFSAVDTRPFLLRVQKALHEAQPVIITWFVDFNALENRANDRRGAFNMSTLTELGPGRQGGHMTVLEDYQVKLSDGTVLAAGQTLDPASSSDQALLARALEPGSEVQFLRVKNSWGAARPDRAFAPGLPGYHDLYLDYLSGPVKKCVERDGNTDNSNCPTTTTPLQNVVLPPGF